MTSVAHLEFYISFWYIPPFGPISTPVPTCTLPCRAWISPRQSSPKCETLFRNKRTGQFQSCWRALQRNKSAQLFTYRISISVKTLVVNYCLRKFRYWYQIAHGYRVQTAASDDRMELRRFYANN